MYRKPEFEPVRSEMIDILKKNIPFLDRKRLIAVEKADGKSAAEDLYAGYDLPNRPVSAFDGIAVCWDAFSKKSGKADLILQEGRDFVYSNTGVAIPDGFDTVIAIESVEKLSAGQIRLQSEELPTGKGEHVEPAGSQIRKGECLLQKDTCITPERIGLLLAAGIQAVEVYAPPRVLVMPTGDELVPSGGPLPDGMNVETNGAMLCALLKRFGAEAAAAGIVPDDPARLRTELLRGVKAADLIVVGAGSSKGSKDFTMDVLRELGEVIVQEIGVAPGKHVSLVMIGGVPVIGVPGPPGGALLAGRYYLRQVISLLMTGNTAPLLGFEAELTDRAGGLPIDFIQPVRPFWQNGRLFVQPLKVFDETRAAACDKGAAMLYCPKGSPFHAGDRVRAELPDVPAFPEGMNCGDWK